MQLKFFSTNTLKNSVVTLSGTLITGALGALFYIILARVLGPEKFGLLSISVAVLTLVTDIANLGTDSGLVRFVGQYIKEDKLKAYRYLKLILKIRLMSALVVIILGWVLTPFIAVNVFQKESLILPLRLAFLGVSGAQVFAFCLSSFQALQIFSAWSLIQISTNSLRILIIFLLLIFARLDLISGFTIYIILPIIGFFASLLFLPIEFLRVKGEDTVLPSLFHYSKWIALSVMIAAFSSRLGTFISGRLLSASQVGFYAAASQLVIIVPQIMRSLDTVFAPKMAQLQSKKELKIYLKRTLILVGVLCGLGLLASPVVLFLIPFIYGPAYTSSVPVLFMILLLANLVFLLSVPLHNAVNYFFRKPQLFIYTSLLHLLVIGFLGWWLISLFGAMGAAITVLFSMILNLVIPAFWVVLKLRKD